MEINVPLQDLIDATLEIKAADAVVRFDLKRLVSMELPSEAYTFLKGIVSKEAVFRLLIRNSIARQILVRIVISYLLYLIEVKCSSTQTRWCPFSSRCDFADRFAWKR